MRRAFAIGILLLVTFGAGRPVHAGADAAGRIAGVVKTSDQSPVAGVTVTLSREKDTLDAAVTAEDGSFTFHEVKPGAYDLLFTLGKRAQAHQGVAVTAGNTTRVEEPLDWEVGYAESITVVSASRRRERIVDAPSAITTVSEDLVEEAAPTGQVPKLIEFTPGVTVYQGGLYDYNVNARGFNRVLNRRVQTLVDGRDVSIAFLQAQEWLLAADLSDDLAAVELLRGPSSALHGANAFNGVLSLTTNAPRDVPGGLLRLSGGELGTAKADLRWATALGSDWYLKLTGGHTESDDFSRSRNLAPEYPGLALEAVPLPDDRVSASSGAVRLDRYIGADQLLTLEGGVGDGRNDLFLTPGGRSLIRRLTRPWLRANYNRPHWNLLGYYNWRNAPNSLNLSSGGRNDLEDRVYSLELQGNTTIGGKLRLVGGGSFGGDHVDSADDQGNQTLLSEPVDTNRGALFGQVDYEVSDALKLVGALRFDDSSLFEAQLSPKAAAVYSITPDHKLRASYNRAFQSANYGELYIHFLAGVIDLSPIEAAFAPLLGGVPLGLESVPIQIRGNQDLKVEKIDAFELGYSGILGGRALLNANYYYNRIRDFITDVLPGANPAYPAYRAPGELPPPIAQLIEQVLNEAVFGLSNAADGSAELVLSIGNTGKVTSQGVELGVNCVLPHGLEADLSYTWFDFKIDEITPGLTIPANTARNSVAMGLAYRHHPYRASARYRWVDDFPFSSGVFAGAVPAYGVVDAAAAVELNRHFQVELNISNLLDDEHYEIFGGSLIRRRALGSLLMRW